MNAQRYTVSCNWDDDAKVWFVADTDVPGLATEAATVEELERKLLTMIPELLGLNAANGAAVQSVPFELIARKQELAKSA
jgi:predicted RNase H-like HicB family nuclease